MTIRHFDTWIAARNASMADYGTGWERIGCREGFVMIHRFARVLVALIVSH